ncbi:hypothetical protein BMF94_0733 [Rhodotorula taiwanensis]|uniref:COP9 signalosome complex subunit 6 n=1 Tax=Rhodotorula taiwanensis TaxID=741276 RepID=A0A2S5BGW2_9BASI|nr:hypothetical protein BMF94_0733 [Rhodotorula taiwanensis]
MTSTQGLKVALHPLAILSISEHYTRTAIQSASQSTSSTPPQVVGALLGTQSGRELEVVNSFELVADPEAGLDHAYLVTRRDQFKQVFPTFDFLGWYSVGQQPSPRDTALHQQFLEYNESPIFLQLSPPSSQQLTAEEQSSKGDLPLAIYESVVELVAGEAKPTFVPVPYEVVTGEAERVAVEGVSKPEAGADGGAQGNLIVALSTQRNALQMLSDRVALIVQYLDAVSRGQARRDDETLRMIASLAGTLPSADAKTMPAMESASGGEVAMGSKEGESESGPKGELELEFMTEYNDVLLTTYLSALTKQLETANALLDKQLLVVSGQASGKEGGGPGGPGGEGGGGGRRRRAAYA